MFSLLDSLDHRLIGEILLQTYQGAGII